MSIICHMSVKQHILRQRSPYDASAMKFQLLFCRLPNPPLTTPTKPPHTLSVRRCPFSPLFFFVGFPTAANQRVPKKNFTTSETSSCETSSCVSRAIELGGAGEGTNRQCYVAVSHLIQLWQSHIVAVFSLLFFPSCCSTRVTILPFDINLASYSMLLFASSTMSNFSP